MAVRPTLLASSSLPLKSLMGLGAPGEATATLVVAVVAFFLGEVLDASRDLLEGVWDRFQPVEWDFFAKAQEQEVDRLRVSYFTYYAFDCNVSLALAILLLSPWVAALFQVWVGLGGPLTIVVLVVFLVVFAWNARQLRGEIASLTRDWDQRKRLEAAQAPSSGQSPR
jgi:hypothetical protein